MNVRRLIERVKEKEIMPWDLQSALYFIPEILIENAGLSKEEIECLEKACLTDLEICTFYYGKDYNPELPEDVKEAIRDARELYPAWGMCLDWCYQSCIDYDFDKVVTSWLEKQEGYVEDSIKKIYAYASRI